MATTFGFYSDPACLTPIASSLAFVQADAAPTPADRVVYFGSRHANRWAIVNGGGNIVASLSGPAAANVALALSAGGLAAATPGASLVIGTQVDGGPAGVVPVHIRVLDTTSVVGQRPFAITTNTVEEWEL